MQELRQRFGDTLPPLAELTEALDGLIAFIAVNGAFNMLLSDGFVLFAHCSTNLFYVIHQYSLASAKLSDEDLSVDFSQLTTPNDRFVVIVPQPVTDNETWVQFDPGEWKVFIDGCPQQKQHIISAGTHAVRAA